MTWKVWNGKAGLEKVRYNMAGSVRLGMAGTVKAWNGRQGSEWND